MGVDLEQKKPSRSFWTLRAAPGEFEYGQPWTFRADVYDEGDGVALIEGGVGKMWPGLRAEIARALLRLGFTFAYWARPGGKRVHVDLRRVARK